MREAEQTTSNLVARLEAAIRSQRVEVVSDANVVLASLQQSLRTTLIWVAVIVGIVNLAGIVAAVFAAKGVGP